MTSLADRIRSGDPTALVDVMGEMAEFHGEEFVVALVARVRVLEEMRDADSDLLHTASLIIANASGGDAATRWRERSHARLTAIPPGEVTDA